MSYSKNYLFLRAKDNRKRLTNNFFNKNIIADSDEKIAIFMAGSPWAWKTEFINRLLTKEQQSAYYILDLDIIRKWMPWYKWNYAEKYTKWAIKILEMMFDKCVSKKYNFILDWTFTNTEVINKNITRLVEKWYKIEIFYIHTQPYLAWRYTLLRWSDDKRRIPFKEFIKYYHLAKDNIYLAIKNFENKINVNLVHKFRDDKWNIILDENIYNPKTIDEINDIFDKYISFHYNLWKWGIEEKLFFYITKIISLIPIIWKLILRKLAMLKEIEK